MLLPLRDNLSEPVQDAYRLIFVNALIVYYSYQHPIAFLSNDRLVVRDQYWNRRRGERKNHVNAILCDAARQADFENLEISEDFLADLHDELMSHGVGAAGKTEIPCKPNTNKRRVTL